MITYRIRCGKKDSVLLVLCRFTIFVSFVLNLILGMETTKIKSNTMYMYIRRRRKILYL